MYTVDVFYMKHKFSYNNVVQNNTDKESIPNLTNMLCLSCL